MATLDFTTKPLALGTILRVDLLQYGLFFSLFGGVPWFYP